MRIALCISGQPRFIERGHECFLKNLILKNNCDVFLHTWYDKSATKWDTNRSLDIHREGLDEKIIQLYQPKKFIVEPQKDCLTRPSSEYYGGHILSPVDIMFSMFYSIKKANDLKIEYEQENNFKYDYVIRTRFDGGLLQEFDLTKYNVDGLRIYFVDVIKNDEAICDWLFFGNSSTMDIMCSTYSFLDEYFEQKTGHGCGFCGENLLIKQAKNNNIRYEGIPVSFFLIRDSEFKDQSYYGKHW